MSDPSPISGLLPVEQFVLDHVVSGEIADIRQCPSAEVDDGGYVPMSASFLRDIIIGKIPLPGPIDPHGIQLAGAFFKDRIDLNHVTFKHPLIFAACIFQHGIGAFQSCLGQFALISSRLSAAHITGHDSSSEETESKAAFDLAQASLKHSLIIHNCDISGPSRLDGTTIGSQLLCTDSTLHNGTGTALSAEHLSVHGNTALTGKFTGNGLEGSVRLFGAHIDGQLDCHGGVFSNSRGPALAADHMATSGHVHLASAFTANHELGAVRLAEATIGGQLICDNGTFENNQGPALYAPHILTSGDINLAGKFYGSGENGAVCLTGGHINGQLNCKHGEFHNEAGPAFDADSLTVTSDTFITGLFKGAGPDGSVRLCGATLGGQLSCKDVILYNGSGPALCADAVTTKDTFFTGKYIGNTDCGTIRLLSAHIDGQLNLGDGSFSNNTGPAINGNGLTSSGDLYIAGSFSGAGASGAVCLDGARIGGQLQCAGEFQNETGPAFTGYNTYIGSNALLSGNFIGTGPKGALHLSMARIQGILLCDGTMDWREAPAADPKYSFGGLDLTQTTLEGNLILASTFHAKDTPARWLQLDGLTYRGQPNLGANLNWWLGALANETIIYAPQPWQQLARACTEAGHPQDAIRVLIAQQDDRRLRHRDHPKLLWWSKKLVGYGYQPWRAWIGLLLVAIIGVGAALGLGSVRDTWPGTETTTAVAAYPPTDTTPATPCSWPDRVGMGLSWTVPLASFASNGCQINTSVPAGQTLAIISYVLQIMGWAMAAIAVAGYTGIVKRL